MSEQMNNRQIQNGEAVSMADVYVQLGIMQTEIKDISRRIDNLEKLTESVHKMAISLERLTSKQDSIEEYVSQLEDNEAKIAGDVEELKNKPAKRWEAVVAALIAGIIGAVIGRLFK